MQQTAESSYFRFSKKERNGILILLSVILAVWMLPFFIRLLSTKTEASQNNNSMPLSELSDSLQQIMTPVASDSVQWKKDQPDSPTEPKDPVMTKATLFVFDPNELDEAGWIRLGIPAKTARTILRYREKGGRFRQPEDLKKIWGLSPGNVHRLLPWVRIQQEKEHLVLTGRQTFQSNKQQPRPIDINQADSAAWESLPGIGPSLARRVVSFREKLGGFYSVKQVSETFGLPDSVFQRILPFLQCPRYSLRKIKLNRAGPEELKSHPYIRYKLAALIEAYRKQHGDFSEISAIKKIPIVTDSLYEKLNPYLSLE